MTVWPLWRSTIWINCIEGDGNAKSYDNEREWFNDETGGRGGETGKPS